MKIDPLEVSFSTSDGGKIYALQYGESERAVVLAHGAIFNKESWETFSQVLGSRGFLVLAIDFRGYGNSVGGSDSGALYEDILAAVRFIRDGGAKWVAVIGGSMGGGAAANAAINANAGEIDKLVLLSAVPVKSPEKIKPDKLFIASKEESLAERIKEQYALSVEPKELFLVDGAAHAQHIFKTEYAADLEEKIISFLLKEK